MGARLDHRRTTRARGRGVQRMRRGHALRADPLPLAERRRVLAVASRAERAAAPGGGVRDGSGRAAAARPEACGELATEEREHFLVALELVLLDPRLGGAPALRFLDPKDLWVGDEGGPAPCELVEDGADHVLGLRAGALGDRREAR